MNTEEYISIMAERIKTRNEICSSIALRYLLAGIQHHSSTSFAANSIPPINIRTSHTFVVDPRSSPIFSCSGLFAKS
jgi:hypothetical protein